MWWCSTCTCIKATASTCCGRCKQAAPQIDVYVLTNFAIESYRQVATSAGRARLLRQEHRIRQAARGARLARRLGTPARNPPSRARGGFRAVFQPPPIGARQRRPPHWRHAKSFPCRRFPAGTRASGASCSAACPARASSATPPDVEEAIGGILAAKPDLVLLDLLSRSGSGFDVLSAVREQRAGIDFYMLSNFASEPYRRHAERLGARGFFDKSKDFERVRDVVAQRAAQPTLKGASPCCRRHRHQASPAECPTPSKYEVDLLELQPARAVPARRARRRGPRARREPGLRAPAREARRGAVQRRRRVQRALRGPQRLLQDQRARRRRPRAGHRLPHGRRAARPGRHRHRAATTATRSRSRTARSA